VEAAVESVDLMGGERGTEEDEDDGDEGSAECDGEDERENARLLYLSQYKRSPSVRAMRRLTTSFAPNPVSPPWFWAIFPFFFPRVGN
jgi:hypothetical protein